MTTQTYRTRNKPTPTTGTFRVTRNRAHRVLDPLSRYARLPTNHLLALYGSRHVYEILKRLYHEPSSLPYEQHLLTRPQQINRNVGTHVFHELAPGAYQHLTHPEDLVRRTRIGRDRRDAHDTHLCMIVASIEAALKAPHRFVSHLEILSYKKCPQETRDALSPISFQLSGSSLMPDALFGIETAGTYQFYAMEFDRGSESLTVISDKLRGYEEVFERELYRTRFGLPNLRILWMTTALARERNMRAKVQRYHDAYLFQSVPKFHLFDQAPEPCLSLVCDEWLTARGTTRLI